MPSKLILILLILHSVEMLFSHLEPNNNCLKFNNLCHLFNININRINALGWGMGTALGAVTGMLIAPLNYLDPGMMGDVALKAFAAAVLGGLTSLPGAVVGGLLLGIIDSVVGFQVPELRTTIAFVLIVLVLVVRPSGLLGKHEIKKV